MTQDARFEDGAAERPLRLKAFDAEDLAVMAAMVQDAVLPVTEIKWDRKARRLGLLLNRFRWERGASAVPERVRAVLAIEDVLAVSSQGVDRKDSSVILSVLAVDFEPAEDGTGCVTITLAGDGAIAIKVEALEITLHDVTRPYKAPSAARPNHAE